MPSLKETCPNGGVFKLESMKNFMREAANINRELDGAVAPAVKAKGATV